MRREPRNGRGSWLIRIPHGMFGKCVCAVLLATPISFAYVRLTTPKHDVRLASSEGVRLARPEDLRLGNSFEVGWQMFPEPTTPSSPDPNLPLPETLPSTIGKNEPASLAPVPDIPTKLTVTAPIPPLRRAGTYLPRSRQAHRYRSLNVTPRSPDEIALSAYSPATPLPQICLPLFFLFMSPHALPIAYSIAAYGTRSCAPLAGHAL
jgi:hypothetical protein